MTYLKTPWIAFLLVAAALVAGCHETPAPVDNGTPPPENGNGEQPTALFVEVIQAPTAAVVGETYHWSWEVSGPNGEAIPHTAIHYGNMSVPSDPSPAAYAHGTNAPDYYSGVVPQIINHEVVFEEAGTVYFRAHAVVGGTHFWTDEQTIAVSQA